MATDERTVPPDAWYMVQVMEPGWFDHATPRDLAEAVKHMLAEGLPNCPVPLDLSTLALRVEPFQWSEATPPTHRIRAWLRPK